MENLTIADREMAMEESLDKIINLVLEKNSSNIMLLILPSFWKR